MKSPKRAWTGIYTSTCSAYDNKDIVGVMGDFRTYDYTLALRSNYNRLHDNEDWARIPYDVLEKISSRIVNEVDLNRIVYDITSLYTLIN